MKKITNLIQKGIALDAERGANHLKIVQDIYDSLVTSPRWRSDFSDDVKVHGKNLINKEVRFTNENGMGMTITVVYEHRVIKRTSSEETDIITKKDCEQELYDKCDIAQCVYYSPHAIKSLIINCDVELCDYCFYDGVSSSEILNYINNIE